MLDLFDLPIGIQDGMPAAARAFEVLGRILKINGRRKLRAEAEIRMRLVRPHEQSAARRAPMLKRKARRDRVRELRKDSREKGMKKKDIVENLFFRPVVGYLGLPLKDSHEDAIDALKYGWLHRKEIAVEKKKAEAKKKQAELEATAKEEGVILVNGDPILDGKEEGASKHVGSPLREMFEELGENEELDLLTRKKGVDGEEAA